MSGRFNNNYRRGNGNNRKYYHSDDENSQNRFTKKNVDHFMFHVGTPNTAANFTKTRDVLINHIYETYENSEDIGKALENLEKCDLTKVKPTLKKSKKTSKEAQEVENEQFKLEFKTDYDEYKKRERVLAANMTKAYAFLWSHCTKEMQDQVQARKEFSKTIKGDPIELLKPIRQHALDYQENRYVMKIVHDSMKALFMCKAKEGESLQNWTERFIAAKQVFESHIGGPLILSKIVENMPGYDEKMTRR